MEREKSKAYSNGEDEEQEDEKMEEFFALIRNFQEARDRRRNELKQKETKTEKRENKVRRLNNNEQPSWVPSFEWADFNGEIEFRKPPIIYPAPHNSDDDNKKKQQHDDEEEDGLDLKLTL